MYGAGKGQARDGEAEIFILQEFLKPFEADKAQQGRTQLQNAPKQKRKANGEDQLDATLPSLIKVKLIGGKRLASLVSARRQFIGDEGEGQQNQDRLQFAGVGIAGINPHEPEDKEQHSSGYCRPDGKANAPHHGCACPEDKRHQCQGLRQDFPPVFRQDGFRKFLVVVPYEKRNDQSDDQTNAQAQIQSRAF